MLFRIWLLLLIVVPALEIVILFQLGSLIGGWETFALIILTALIGGWLTKREATKVWHYIKWDMSQRNMPTHSILDGICVFVGGLLLLLPGFLTDLLGFLLVVPFTRTFFRGFLLILVQKLLPGIQIFMNGPR